MIQINIYSEEVSYIYSINKGISVLLPNIKSNTLNRTLLEYYVETQEQVETIIGQCVICEDPDSIQIETRTWYSLIDLPSITNCTILQIKNINSDRISKGRYNLLRKKWLVNDDEMNTFQSRNIEERHFKNYCWSY